MGFLNGAIFGVPNNRGYNILGSILGSSYAWKYHISPSSREPHNTKMATSASNRHEPGTLHVVTSRPSS